MPLKIKRLPRARIDRTAIWLHVAEDSIAAADRLTDRFDEIVGHLADFPQAGRERTELADGLRAFPVDHYLVFYRVTPTALEIVRIFHTSRKITPDMLSD